MMQTFLKEAGIFPAEKVEVLNLNNGARIETYVIEGEESSGTICLNGPASRFFEIGDKIIIVCYGLIEEDKIKNHKVRFVKLDGQNKIKDTCSFIFCCISSGKES